MKKYLQIILFSLILITLLIQISILIRGAVVHEEMQDIDIRLFKWIHVLFYSPKIIGLTLLLIAIIGFFIHNYFGWLSLTNLFYFYIIEYLAYYMPSHNNTFDWRLALIFIPLIVIGFINLKGIRANYGIKPKQTILMNMISISIAMILTMIKRQIFLFNTMSIDEMIEKVM